MVILGLLFGLAGSDINSGVRRFTYDIQGLADGIEFVALSMAIYGLAEVAVEVFDAVLQALHVGDHQAGEPARERLIALERVVLARAAFVRAAALALARGIVREHRRARAREGDAVGVTPLGAGA